MKSVNVRVNEFTENKEEEWKKELEDYKKKFYICVGEPSTLSESHKEVVKNEWPSTAKV